MKMRGYRIYTTEGEAQGCIYSMTPNLNCITGLYQNAEAFLFQPGWNICTDVEFINFQKTLHAQMKKLKSEGIGNTKRQAEPISSKDEEQLWTTGLLGMHTPQVLLDTIFYLIGMSFGLRGGREHCQLR